MNSLDFATKAHGNQKRKYTDEPYIVHPMRVAEIVKSVGGSIEMIKAAYLHDVVEDTDITLKDIRTAFGSEVCGYVGDLTDISKLEDGNRKIRKEIDRNHIEEGSANSHTIKLADILDNGYDIWKNDKDFAVVYFKEIELLLSCLADGNEELFEKANRMVVDYYISKLES